MSKICKSVLLPPALIAMLGLSGIASAAQESATNDLTQIQNVSVLDINLVSGAELQEGISDSEIAGVQCTNYSSGEPTAVTTRRVTQKSSSSRMSFLKYRSSTSKNADGRPWGGRPPPRRG